MRRLICPLCVTLVCAFRLSSVAAVSPPAVEWEKTEWGPEITCATCVQQTSDDGFILCGRWGGGDSVDVGLRKTDSQGTEICPDATDTNDDSELDLADAIALLTHLFADNDGLPAPFPDCGLDPTEDALGCDSFAPCATGKR